MYFFSVNKHYRSSLVLSKMKYHVTFHMENCSNSMSIRVDQHQDKTLLAGTLLETAVLVC